jgi:putative transcriptional regulator
MLLFAERNLRITKVSEDTGISRTTLTALSNNTNQGIQFDTLNKLCIYLQITPEQFFSFLPYDIYVRLDKIYEDQFLITLSITEKGKKSTFTFYAITTIDYRFFLEDDESGTTGKEISKLDIEIEISNPAYQDTKEAIDDTAKQNYLLIKQFAQAPFWFRQEVENRVVDEIALHYHDEIPDSEEEYTITVSWPSELIR